MVVKTQFWTAVHQHITTSHSGGCWLQVVLQSLSHIGQK